VEPTRVKTYAPPCAVFGVTNLLSAPTRRIFASLETDTEEPKASPEAPSVAVSLGSGAQVEPARVNT
jgi:hypothetical protein